MNLSKKVYCQRKLIFAPIKLGNCVIGKVMNKLY